jgi:excisionase family DNA binding protein
VSIPNPRRLDDLPAFLTVPEAAALLRLGRTACYEAVARGEIPSLKFGAKLRIPRAALMALARGHPVGNDAERAADHANLSASVARPSGSRLPSLATSGSASLR